jgi:hypothetical protein
MADYFYKNYISLLENLLNRGYQAVRFQDFSTIEQSGVIFRHDVDLLPNNALKMAEIEHGYGINGTYYFRIVPESYNVEIMKKIAALGHEIGYHYEDVDIVHRRMRSMGVKITCDELIDLAYESFCKNLALFRENFEVNTICMHGSPMAQFDNKIIWEKYNYRDLGLIGEPYFDIDFNEFAYFTDTGRRWNGGAVSIRDKVDSKFNFDFKSTQDILDNIDKLPPKIMFTIHPQRWNDSILPWMKELISQSVKNVVKRAIVRRND